MNFRQSEIRLVHVCEGHVKSHELLLLTYQSNYPSYPAVPETEYTYILYRLRNVWQMRFCMAKHVHN